MPASFVCSEPGSFWLLLMGPIHAQRDDRLLDCWQSVFPRWDRPWTVPGWLLQRLTEVLRYAYEPVGNASAEFEAYYKSELAKFAEVVRQAHIPPQD